MKPRAIPQSTPVVDQPSRESRIKVVVRKRPLSKKELGQGRKDILERKGKAAIVVYEPKTKVDLTPYIENHEFMFDQAFDEFTSNEDLYLDAVRPLVGEAFATKAKCTCFAYGQTGSGKTFTMMGPNRVNPGEVAPPGLFALAAQDIFRYVQLPEYDKITVHVSFYEIYCGKLHDLLNGRRVLAARDNGQQKVVICGLTEVPVTNGDDFMACINYGLTSRTTSATGANLDSSRSHAILQIALKDERARDAGRITFIDLAGSERGADVVDASRQTARDGAEINKSLLALKECIRALDLQKDHTPFRGSKLTMVLKESFLGNCRTLMIANLNPTDSACEHTLNTLRYAYRVKELKGGARAGDDEPTSVPVAIRNIRPSGRAQQQPAAQFEDDDESSFPEDYEEEQDDGDSEFPQVPHPASQLPPPPPTTQGPPPSLVAMLQSARSKANASIGAAPVDGPAPEPSGIQQVRKSTTGPRSSSAFGRAVNQLEAPSAHDDNMSSRPDSPSVPMKQQQSLSSNLPARRQSVQQASQRSIRHPEGTRLNTSVSGNSSANSVNQPPVKMAVPSNAPPTPTGLREIITLTNNSSATLNDLANAHDRLIGTILVEEEELIQGHRSHIDLLVDLIKDEMNLLSEVERSGSDVEVYVQGLKRVLEKKQRSVAELANRLNSFERYLEAEEMLSARFQ